jgi:hypothetical protein
MATVSESCDMDIGVAQDGQKRPPAGTSLWHFEQCSIMDHVQRNRMVDRWDPRWTSRRRTQRVRCIGRKVLYAWLVWATATEKRSPEAPFEYHDPTS